MKRPFQAHSVGIVAHKLCESRGGRPGLPVPNKPYGLCERKATLNQLTRIEMFRAQELCEGPGGRPGLPVPNKPCGFCGRKATLKRRHNRRHRYV